MQINFEGSPDTSTWYYCSWYESGVLFQLRQFFLALHAKNIKHIPLLNYPHKSNKTKILGFTLGGYILLTPVIHSSPVT